MAKVGLVGCSGFGREVMPLLKVEASARFQSAECIFVDNKYRAYGRGRVQIPSS